MKKIIVRDRYKKCGLTFFKVFVIFNMLFFWVHLIFSTKMTETIHKNQIEEMATLEKLKCSQLYTMVINHHVDPIVLKDCDIYDINKNIAP